jgi:hypothetical protein
MATLHDSLTYAKVQRVVKSCYHTSYGEFADGVKVRVPNSAKLRQKDMMCAIDLLTISEAVCSSVHAASSVVIPHGWLMISQTFA